MFEVLWTKFCGIAFVKANRQSNKQIMQQETRTLKRNACDGNELGQILILRMIR